MKAPEWLPSVVLCIGILMISINFWYLVYVPNKYKLEGFNSPDIQNLSNDIISNAFSAAGTEKVPSDTEAAQNYRNVIIYMKNNTMKGIKIIDDINKRVYGHTTPVPDTYDPRNLLDNFVNPITGM